MKIVMVNQKSGKCKTKFFIRLLYMGSLKDRKKHTDSIFV